MLGVCLRTTPYGMLSDVIAYGLCHNNEWKLVYQFSKWYGEKKNYVVLALKKPGYYNWYQSSWLVFKSAFSLRLYIIILY